MLSRGGKQFDFNSWIEKATEAISCDAECQKEKTAKELEQKYLDARLRVANASNNIETAQKNYMVFVHGEDKYNEFKRKQLTLQGKKIATFITNKFNEELQFTKENLDSYDSLSTNFRHMIDLYLKYKKENIELEKELKDKTSDIITNDRKTYYEDQGTNTLHFFYLIFMIIYYIGVVVYLISLFIYPSQRSIGVNIVIIFAMAVYPFLSLYIFKKLYMLYNWIVYILPKNVYKNP